MSIIFICEIKDEDSLDLVPSVPIGYGKESVNMKKSTVVVARKERSEKGRRLY